MISVPGVTAWPHVPLLCFALQTEYARYENGHYSYRIHRSPLCEYMINFIHKLKHLPEKYMMNSVLENFTILQVPPLLFQGVCPTRSVEPALASTLLAPHTPGCAWAHTAPEFQGAGLGGANKGAVPKPGQVYQIMGSKIFMVQLNWLCLSLTVWLHQNYPNNG